MKISCSYCGIVDKPHRCPKRQRRTDRARVDNKVYESKEYRKVRKKVLEAYDYKCLWSIYVDGRVRTGELTHHIIEVLEDESKATDFNNLIPLTDRNHDIVHKLYKKDKEKVQRILKAMLDDYSNGIIEFKKYKYILEI